MITNEVDELYILREEFIQMIEEEKKCISLSYESAVQRCEGELNQIGEMFREIAKIDGLMSINCVNYAPIIARKIDDDNKRHIFLSFDKKDIEILKNIMSHLLQKEYHSPKGIMTVQQNKILSNILKKNEMILKHHKTFYRIIDLRFNREYEKCMHIVDDIYNIKRKYFSNVERLNYMDSMDGYFFDERNNENIEDFIEEIDKYFDMYLGENKFGRRKYDKCEYINLRKICEFCCNENNGELRNQKCAPLLILLDMVDNKLQEHKINTNKFMNLFWTRFKSKYGNSQNDSSIFNDQNDHIYNDFLINQENNKEREILGRLVKIFEEYEIDPVDNVERYAMLISRMGNYQDKKYYWESILSKHNISYNVDHKNFEELFKNVKTNDDPCIFNELLDNEEFQMFKKHKYYDLC
jgi:hypothetical protein